MISSKFLAIFLAILLAITLTACGGGNPGPDKPTPSVDCKAHPEMCR